MAIQRLKRLYRAVVSRRPESLQKRVVAARNPCAIRYRPLESEQEGIMTRVLQVGAIFFICFGLICIGTWNGLSGQTRDTRLDDAVKEIAALKLMAADQDRRIAGLERTVRSLHGRGGAGWPSGPHGRSGFRGRVAAVPGLRSLAEIGAAR
jgi:hypothetical protein